MRFSFSRPALLKISKENLDLGPISHHMHSAEGQLRKQNKNRFVELASTREK